MQVSLNKLAVGAIVAIAAAASAGSPALACGTRHFYNNSTITWDLYMIGRSTCSIGSYTGNHCVIPAGQVADIHYNDTYGGGVGVESAIFARQNYSHDLSCYIDHSGNTGNIVVNSDADGDIATCGPKRFGQTNGGYRCIVRGPQ
ncbi:MAG TPA: hypothetical protein VKX28_21265 [Xanthobacteraceae bacterium]|jgi:hypothetical protein|nr:hypothetical protein [Xanthobacteraceae bacterium]